jgi:mediator of RNA polymerase II transcription subunit 13
MHVIQDASRPWLWHFERIAVDMVGQDTMLLPVVEGYHLRSNVTMLLRRQCANA